MNLERKDVAITKLVLPLQLNKYNEESKSSQLSTRMLKRKPNQCDGEKVLTYKTSTSCYQPSFGFFIFFSVYLKCEKQKLVFTPTARQMVTFREFESFGLRFRWQEALWKITTLTRFSFFVDITNQNKQKKTPWKQKKPHTHLYKTQLTCSAS